MSSVGRQVCDVAEQLPLKQKVLPIIIFFCFLLSLALWWLWEWGVFVVAGDHSWRFERCDGGGSACLSEMAPPITHSLTAYKCGQRFLMAHNEIHPQGCLFMRL